MFFLNEGRGVIGEAKGSFIFLLVVITQSILGLKSISIRKKDRELSKNTMGKKKRNPHTPKMKKKTSKSTYPL